MKKYMPVLEECALFSGLDTENIPAMLGCIGAKVCAFEKNETVFLEGENARQVGVVLSGSVQIVKEDFYGNCSILASIEPSQMFGESFACAQVEKLPVSAVASEKSEIMLVDLRRITSTCSNACAFHRQMIQNLLGIVARKNLMLNQKIEILSQRTTREKLTAYLMNHAKKSGKNEFTIPFDRQALANFLGVERSALSAEISKMKNEGLLDTNRSWFKLL